MPEPSTHQLGEDQLVQRYRTLLEVSEAITAHHDLHDLFRELARRLPRVVDVNFVGVCLHDPERNVMRLHSCQSNVPADIEGGSESTIDESPAGVAWQTQQPVLIPNLAEDHRWQQTLACMREDGIQSCCFIPLTTAVRQLGAVGFGSLKPHAYSTDDLEFLQQVARQVAVAVDNVLHHQALSHDRDRLRLLLEVSESIASYRDLNELFHDLGQRLPRIVPFDYITLILHDPARDIMRLHVLTSPVASTIRPGLELPIDGSSSGLVWKNQIPVVVQDVATESRFPQLIPLLRENGVQSYCTVPLTTALRRLGAMAFGSFQQRDYQEAEIRFMQEVAKQVAVAVDNVLHEESEQSAQQQLTYERDRVRLLLEINNAVVSHLDSRDVFSATTTCLRRVVPNDYTSLALLDPETGRYHVYALDFPTGKGLLREGMEGPIDGTPAEAALLSGKPQLFDEAGLGNLSSEIVKLLLAEGIKSVCSVPLRSHDRVLGTLNIASLRANAFSSDDADLLTQVGTQIAIAVENANSYREIAQLKDRLDKEKVYLEGEIQSQYNFEEIVGDSATLKHLLSQVEIVAPTDSSVLILGETGTGKELIARAIHNHSGRRGRTFVKMNCAAIPTGLLESELFGHERGAFTGAIAQKVGRFELADGGTLFLDEVGDIPLELQSKLLRVLQEQEFERLGGNRTIRVSVRLVSATNRDLAQMVAEKQFRSDLYYRLNVFPLTVPPLRERQEDIPVLTRYFAQTFARRMNKKIETIPAETMTSLSQYHWPGNIRELENLIERAVILSQGTELRVPLAELKVTAGETPGTVTTLEAAEREHILRALHMSNWVIGGSSGAAAQLGMKRTTLQSRMQKLGITRKK
jgi:formate hydrogenlyase transcriptional activator